MFQPNTSNQISAEEQHLMGAISSLRVLAGLTGHDYEDVVERLQSDYEWFTRQQEEAAGAKESEKELAGLTYSQASEGF